MSLTILLRLQHFCSPTTNTHTTSPPCFLPYASLHSSLHVFPLSPTNKLFTFCSAQTGRCSNFMLQSNIKVFEGQNLLLHSVHYILLHDHQEDNACLLRAWITLNDCFRKKIFITIVTPIIINIKHSTINKFKF